MRVRITALFGGVVALAVVLAVSGGPPLAIAGQEAVSGSGAAPLPAQAADGAGEVLASAQPAATASANLSAGLTAASMAQTAPSDVKIRSAGQMINLSVEGAAVREVLRQLAMSSERNIVAGKGVTGVVTADLFNVTFKEALDAVVRITGCGYIEEGNFIYVHTLKELGEIAKAQRIVATRVFPLYYVKPDDLTDLIQPCLSGDGKMTASPAAASGVATSDTETGGMDYAVNDVLVVCDYEENLERVAEVVAEVDKRPQQVLIEATILRATLDEDNALGIDFTALSGVNFSTLASTTSDLTSLSPSEADLDVSAVGSGIGTAKTSFNAGIKPGGLSIGWIGSDIAVFLRALEEVTDTSVVANPKLTVVNKQRGQILVGDRKGYFDVTQTTDTSTTKSVSFLETGTNLIIRPFIGKDGYIRLEVFPKDSSGSVNATSGLPTETTTQCTSNVIVRDGHTIVISGLFREVATHSRNQVPGLGNIPGIGAAFRSTGDTIDREEVIILITPRIIKQAADEAVSEQLRDDIDRFRLGMRENLAWYGRSKLAIRYLSWARTHAAAGRKGWALWDVNMALSMSPTMYEALRLKERITGEAIWANQPRFSSARWVVQKMIMNDLGLNVNTVIPPNKPLDSGQLPQEVRDAMGIGTTAEEVILPEVSAVTSAPPITVAEGADETDRATQLIATINSHAALMNEPVTADDSENMIARSVEGDLADQAVPVPGEAAAETLDPTVEQANAPTPVDAADDTDAEMAVPTIEIGDAEVVPGLDAETAESATEDDEVQAVAQADAQDDEPRDDAPRPAPDDGEPTAMNEPDPQDDSASEQTSLDSSVELSSATDEQAQDADYEH